MWITFHKFLREFSQPVPSVAYLPLRFGVLSKVIPPASAPLQSALSGRPPSFATPIIPFRSGQEAMPMPADFLNVKEEPALSIVLCADNQGSLEAIVGSLPKEINIALQKTGDINRSF